MNRSEMEVRPVEVPVTASDPRQRPGVLVVDDFADGRDVLVEYLRYCGFAVYGAAGGAEAIEMALRLRPRVILMDLAMPGIDGVEATRRLKADDRTKDIIVIALTARAMATDEHAARAVGCDAFIPKPCDLSSLVAVLTRTTSDQSDAN
jgi:CheY-like chemotaxis protein